MPLEWKTTNIYGSRVTHWKKHSLRGLLAALESEPIKEFPASTPPVKFHKFAGQTIVARTTDPRGAFLGNMADNPITCLPPKEIFYILKELAEKKAAFVEVPVALVEGKATHTLVTLAKPHRASLQEVLSDDDVHGSKKLALLVKAIKLFARLNALGYRHNHPGPRNVVVMKNDEVRLIDPTLLQRVPKNEPRNIEHIHSRARLLQPLVDLWRRNSPRGYYPSEKLDIVTPVLDSAYETEFKRVKAKQRV